MMGLKSFNIRLKPDGPGLLAALCRIHSNGGTGVLEIEWDKFKKQIMFKNGEPVGTRSNWLAEAFGQFLIRKKRISEDSLRVELKKKRAEKAHHFLGEWLVENGIIKATEIPGLLEGHFRERLFNLLTLSRGTIRFKPVTDTSEFEKGSVPLTENFEKLMTEAARKLFKPEVCRSKVARYIRRKAIIKDLCSLPLNAREAKVWHDLSMDMKPVSDLDDAGLWVLAIASELEVVEWSVSPTDNLLKEWTEVAERWKGAKANEVLGLATNATVDMAKKAYLQLVKKYHPDKLPIDASDELRNLAQDILARINEANDILTNPEKRKEFEAELELEKAGGFEKVQARINAEAMLPQAKAALRRRHFKQALGMYREIEAVLEGDFEVMADRAYAELMSLVESKSEYQSKLPSLLADIDKSLKMNEKYGSAYFYRGMIFKLLSKEENALSDFDKAVDLDQKLTEAASQARLIRMRRDKKKFGLFGKR